MQDLDRFPPDRPTHSLAPLCAVGWYLDSQTPRPRQPEFPPEPVAPIATPAPDQRVQRQGWVQRLGQVAAHLFRPHHHAET